MNSKIKLNNIYGLKNKYNNIVFTINDLYKSYLEELQYDKIRRQKYRFIKWIENLLDTNEYKILYKE